MSLIHFKLPPFTSSSWSVVGKSIVSIAVLFSATICFSEQKNEHYSTLQGTTAQMRPSGASFHVPSDWTFDLTGRELEKVEKGKGEWYKEYAKIVNASLSFGDCSVRAGSENWDSASFDSMQVRGYSAHGTVEEVAKKISGKGFAALKALPPKIVTKGTINSDDVVPWRRILITYDLWYGDHGGKAIIEFYLTGREGTTVVLVFMHRDKATAASLVRQILDSFSWQ